MQSRKKAKKENRDERNLFLFVFVGHGFERPDGSQYLLCADAINVDKQTELVGGIGPATLNDFSEGLENTDVINWIDACRGQVLRNRGREQYGLDKFRTVSDVDPANSTKRELKIFSCARNQPASDDGLSTVAALDVMRKRLEAGKEIVLGEAFAESWGRRLNKKRLGNLQTPVSNGRPILLASSVKKPEADRSQDQKKIELRQKELDETKRRNADLASKISAFESKSPQDQETIKLLQKELDETKRRNSDLSSKISAFESKPSQKVPNMADYERVLKELEETKRKNVDLTSKISAFESTSKGRRNTLGKIKNIFTPSPSSVWNGTSAGEYREIEIKGKTYDLCWIPPGTFTMGSPPSEDCRQSNESQHEVWLTQGFWMLETPVTQGLWTSVMGNNPSYFCSTGDGSSSVQGMDTTDFPVECVSWHDCQEFLKKLNNLLKMTFELPTEAEWEYACRAGTESPYYWGSSLNGEKANCDGNYPYGTSMKGSYLGRPCAVKSYASNPWGLYDLHGNGWEWCSDWYGAYPSGSVVDPTGPTNASYRVVRGGGWSDYARDCRSACRYYSGPANRCNSLGFRFLSSSR